MNSPQQRLQQLISPEILVEIQTLFLKKHGAVICLFEKTLKPVLDIPQHVPALERMSDEHKNLFELFFDLSSLDAEFLQKQRKQSFAGGTLCRLIFPILFDEDFMGLAVVLLFSKTIDPEHDNPLLQTLSLVKHKSISLRTLLDEPECSNEKLILIGQELQNILQLFLEAGMARANVTSVETDDEPAPETRPHAQSAILFCDPSGAIVDSASNAADFLGYKDPGDLCDLNFLTDVLATDYDREKIRLLFQGQPARSTSVALLLKDESTVQVEVQINVQKTATGVVGFECLLSTTSETMESQDSDSLEKSSVFNYDEQHLAELQTIYRKLQYNLAHVASPLAHKLERFFKVQVDDPAIKKQLADIEHLTKSLSHLNQQLACFVLEEAPERESVDLNHFMQKIAEQLVKRAPKTITIKTQFEKELPRVSINPELLIHAVGNVCKNAMDAMRDGTLLLSTRSNGGEPEQSVSILLQDSGPGFSPSIQKHLFEPFSTTQKHPIAGLGLAAAYGIIKSHNGNISIHSEPGRGSTVILTLPALGAQPAQNRIEKQEPEASQGYILIVDDEQDIADVTAMALRRGGYNVLTCTTCEDAFDVMRRDGDKLDLLILDNQLVGTKGVTCAKNMMTQKPNIPILFYSGAEEDLELMTFIKNYGAGWLKKPFTAKELLSKVSTIIQHTKS